MSREWIPYEKMKGMKMEEKEDKEGSHTSTGPRVDRTVFTQLSHVISTAISEHTSSAWLLIASLQRNLLCWLCLFLLFLFFSFLEKYS
jgi:hypothetical protein